MILAGARLPEHEALIATEREQVKSLAMLHPQAADHTIKMHAFAVAQTVKTLLKNYAQPELGQRTPADLKNQLNEMARACGVPELAGDMGLTGRAARMIDPSWWARNFRVVTLLENEKIEHAQCRIRRRDQVYASDHAVHTMRRRAKATRELLTGLEVVNEDGEAFNLQDVADKSVSNPKLRRAELMMRARGFEETADYMGHVGLFLTLTCPSRFHRFNGQGKENPMWAGETPKDGQDYLCKVWGRIRAAWGRNGWAPYGFRVAEPHHDGCPHWHILLFCAPEAVGWFDPVRLVGGRLDNGAGVIGIAGKHAFTESPAERGAIKHRFTVVLIDPEKGSATAYIAKYICKNIDGLKPDGEGMGLDFASGKNVIEAAERVKVWAQTWKIRQFQQVGGPSVTVWRELRKLGEVQQQNDLFEGPRAAADRALWALFWVLQGGPDVARQQLTLKPWYVAEKTGKYGDEVQRVFGVSGAGETGEVGLQTRLHTWTVQRDGVAMCDLHEAVRIDTRESENRIADYLGKAGIKYTAAHYQTDDEPASVPEFERSGEAATPWTSVNNCTGKNFKSDDEIDEAYDFLEKTHGGGPYAANFGAWKGKPTPKSSQHERIERYKPSHRHNS